MKQSVLLALSAACVLSPLTYSADWSEFSGPNRSNISPETGINKNWNEKPPKEVWSVATGPGFGGAGIADGKVYILDRKDDLQDVLRCFDLNTGNEEWSFGYDAPGQPSFNGSRSTPTIDGQYIYTVGVFGDVYCFDANTQKPVWNRSLKNDFGSQAPNWAYSQSPVRYKDLLIIAPMSSAAGMAALNPKTGDTIWTSEPIGGETYMSPTLFMIDGTDQFYLQTRGEGETMYFNSVNPENGEILWRLQDDGYFNKIPIPSPTHLGDGLLFITGGYGAGSCLLQVKNDGGKWSAEITKKMPNYGAQIHPLVQHNGYLYGNLNTNENLRGRVTPDGLSCINQEGEIIWQAKDSLPINRGGLIVVDGVILAHGDESGNLHMVECTHEGYIKLGSYPVFKGLRDRDNNLWAPLAFSNGKLVVRSQTELKCLDLL